WMTLVDPLSLAEALGVRPGEPAPPPTALPRDIVLLDVRTSVLDPDAGPRLWAEGHVPGAVHAHMDRDLSAKPTARTGRNPVPDLYDFIDTCSRWGVAPGTQVVAYDDKGGVFASRAWWLLRDYGHLEVAVLDGGLPAWLEAGLPVTQEVRTLPAAKFQGRPGHMKTVSSWDLITRMPRRLMDARAPSRYKGEEDPVNPVKGHIVGARNLPTDDTLDEKGRFLPPEVLRAKFEGQLQGLPARDAAVYCGSGITSPHLILAMEVAGLYGAALYPGSWSEWIKDPRRPVGKGEE
ncbi:MAG TPA: sulfurtransferase, partial [Candidatus Thermoplasmatota archaeon]|nr:sulfurtransferase [Candidatus Thermoplasmatota archaeon]